MAAFYRPSPRSRLGREVRRPDRHRRPDRAPRLRGGDLLGRAAARSSTGRRPTCIRPSASAGAAWRWLTTSTACPSTCCRTRPSAATATPRLAPGLALPARLLGRLRGAGQPLDRDAATTTSRPTGCATLLASDEVGPCLVEDAAHRALYIFNHLEYDSDTLKQEYDRDVAAGGADRGAATTTFPDDDPARPPPNRWRSHAHLLYGNWINEIYQTTPYELDRDRPLKRAPPSCPRVLHPRAAAPIWRACQRQDPPRCSNPMSISARWTDCPTPSVTRSTTRACRRGGWSAWLIDLFVILLAGVPIALVFGIATFGLGFALFPFVVAAVGFLYRVGNYLPRARRPGACGSGDRIAPRTTARASISSLPSCTRRSIRSPSGPWCYSSQLRHNTVTRYRQGLQDIILRTTAINRPADRPAGNRAGRPGANNRPARSCSL